ncbi:MAG: type II toxin-antitoxin system VapC family toxin [Thermodesulfobacteriota bacterium]
MIVVDTNIISYLLIPNDTYNPLAEALYQKDSRWSSPILWHHEFMSVLSAYLRQNLIDADGCQMIYKEAMALVVSKPVPDCGAILNIVQDSSLSSYDAEFVALAMETRLPLITEDKKIVREFPDIAFSIETYIRM